MRVIGKAYGDEPLQRVLTGTCGKLAYLINPSVADANGFAPLSGVGFPRETVYEFDLEVFEALCLAWQSEDVECLSRAWELATPLVREMESV